MLTKPLTGEEPDWRWRRCGVREIAVEVTRRSLHANWHDAVQKLPSRCAFSKVIVQGVWKAEL